jgi:hypothetical protein
MSFIRREWTPEAAGHWSREDWIAALLSFGSYLLLIVGGTLALLGSVAGYVALAAGLAAAALTYWVVDPKLRAVSADFEKRQREYIERIEKIVRWEN